MPDGSAGRHPSEHRAPTEATVKELYATALRCGLPGCMQMLYRVSETGDRVLNSRVAHIHARREGGPRWDPAMTEEDNRGYDNLILLCIEDSYEIDDIPDRYPPEMLRDWKRVQFKAQEQAARQVPSLTDDEVADVHRLSFSMKDLAGAIRAALPFPARTREQALDRAVRESAARRKTRLLAVPDDRLSAPSQRRLSVSSSRCWPPDRKNENGHPVRLARCSPVRISAVRLPRGRKAACWPGSRTYQGGTPRRAAFTVLRRVRSIT